MRTCMALTLLELHQLESEGINLGEGDEAVHCDVVV